MTTREQNRAFFEDAVKRLPLIMGELDLLYPEAECTLDYDNPLHLLVSVRLAAQCTDARVNMIAPALFERFPDCKAFADATPEEIEPYIKSTGFYHAKAQNIHDCCKMLLEKYDGKIPDTMEELTALPGVGRKTANLILGDVFGQPSYVVDTHCIRLTGRMGLTLNTEQEKIEQDLRELLPPEKSGRFCHQMVLHGRAVCDARKPMCENCALSQYCPKINVHDKKRA